MILRITLVLILLAITFLSLSPSTGVSVGNDKVGHLLAYFALMMNLGLLVFPNRKSLMLMIVLAIAYGGLMEFGQYFVPGRSVSLLDMLANISGVTIGVLLLLLFGKQILNLLKKSRII